MSRNVATITPEVDCTQPAGMIVKKTINHLLLEHAGKIIGITIRPTFLPLSTICCRNEAAASSFFGGAARRFILSRLTNPAR